ncbi:MAG: AsmA family protein [Pseudomonadota bacterium]|nr:AsmA family protein [Pseudomonadota bacterium]
MLGRLVLVVVGLLLAAAATQPLWLAPLLGRHLSSTSGRSVHFDSVRLGLTSSLAPVVHLHGVRIDNAPWADTKEPFAALADAVFVFTWRPFEGRHVVSSLLLRDGVVNLELRADGLRNWRLTDPEDRGPGRYWFFSLEGHGATLAFIHHGIDLRFRAAATDGPSAAIGSAAALPTRIDFDGEFRKVAFNGSVATGPVLTLMQTGRWFGLRGHAAVEGVDLDVDGRAADIFRATQIDANATMAGRSLAVLRPFVGEQRYAEPRAFRVQGHLRSAAAHYALTDAQARIGATDLAGDVAWSRSGSRRAVRVHLKSGATDLADLLWLTGRPASSLPKTVSAAASAASSSAEHDLFAAARDLDADVAFEATRFHVAALHALQSLGVKADLAAGRLAVSDLDVGWAGGHSVGKLTLDLTQPLASADATLETRGVRIESLIGAQEEKKRITGALRSRLALKASGNTAEALRASVSGTATVALSGGTISSLLDAEIGLEGGKLVRTLISGVDFLPLPCAAATLDLSAGKAHIRNLVIDSANTLTTGSGTIDLRDAAIDLVLTPQPKRPGLFELQRSIHLFGHLPKPQRALVDRVEPVAATACEATNS